jgi:lysosomal Pro-X carboxypeptidase
MDPGSFAKIVTRDATPAAGAAGACAGNMRAAWKELLKRADDQAQDGWSSLSKLLRLCPSARQVTSVDDLYSWMDWAQSSFDYMAMGNYPYPSSYILNGNGEVLFSPPPLLPPPPPLSYQL